MNQTTKKALPQPLKAYIFSPKRAVFLGICAVIFTTYLTVNLKTDKIYAATGINRTINFQGKVVNKDGTNVADGQYTFVFKLYDAASGGANPWTETQNNVQVTAGVFRVSLGSVTTFASANVDFNTDNLYLGINFSSDGEMTPRIRFTAVPYAINAQRVAGLTVTDTTGTLTIPNAKTVQFGGAFTTSAQDLTLTLSGATNVTLPTTGTLATLGGIESLSNKTFTTSIVTSGVTTDLTTVSNEDFSIVPNGTGKVLINTTTGLASFDVRQNAQNGGTIAVASVSGRTSFAALVADNSGLGDLFTASNAGVTRFAITRVGGFRLGTSEGNSGQCLTSGGAGSGASWGTCGGAGTWDVGTTLGVHYPGNNTLDLLVGGSSTQSASFSVLGIASGASPTASVSAQTGSNATKGLYMAGDGSLQSVRKNTLVIGGGTTGDIQFMPGNASTSLYLASNGSIRFNGSTGNAQDCLVSAGSSSAPVWGSCLTGTAGNFWNLNAAQGTTYSINTTLDLLWGGTTTNSAGFRVSGATKNFGTVAAASVSANTSFAGFVMDNRGSGDIFTASSAGETRLTLF